MLASLDMLTDDESSQKVEFPKSAISRVEQRSSVCTKDNRRQNGAHHPDLHVSPGDSRYRRPSSKSSPSVAPNVQYSEHSS